MISVQKFLKRYNKAKNPQISEEEVKNSKIRSKNSRIGILTESEESK